MPDPAPIERTYNALYRHSVDAKRRIPIPFRWRPEEAGEFTIVVWAKHQAGACLRVLPPDQWARLRASINIMSDSDPKKPLLKRQIGTNSIQAKLDNAGRITIPEEMAAAADLKHQAVLVGMLDKFEIWSPERHKVMEAADKVLLPEALQLME